VLDEIGAGRFGPVYRARAESETPGTEAVEGIVAIKVFDQGLSADGAAALAQALMRLSEAPLDHPSIVAPVGAGLNGETAWMAEPYVEGTPLDAILRRQGPLPLADVVLRITQVAGALDFAAATGIFHGALHPRDILFAGDRTLVTGFGVVQALSEADLDVPMSGASVSPQRARRHPVTRADDIFALAAVTFELLYGRALDDASLPPSLVTPLTGVDHVRLRGILKAALADDPADRPSTALEFASELQGCLVTDSLYASPRSSSRVRGSEPDPDSDSDAAAVTAIRRSPPAQMPNPVDDLPLRAAEHPALSAREFEPELESPAPRLELANPSPAVGSRSPQPEAQSQPRGSTREFEFERQSRSSSRSLWLPIVTTAVLTFLFGFASGYVVGQRDATPAPRSAERAVPRAEREAAQAPVPAPTAGQDFTESSVPPTAVEEPDVKPTEPVPSPEPQRLARAEPERSRQPLGSGSEPEPSGPERAEPTGPASIEIVSRPSGAQVFLDNRLVGRTPLVLSTVDPGGHSVRIALPGHQRWATTVNVEAGSRARVAASLER
jgi:serine/threonine protein kinase